jgi:Cu+-exporting ATPase
MTVKKKKIKIIGMTCSSCAQTIEKALNKAEGVINVRVNLATETAYIEYNDKKTNEKKLTEVIKNTGYDVSERIQRISVGIGGMTCASCAQTIGKALLKTEGITDATVNLATEKASVNFFPSKAGYEDIKKAIEDTGYEVLDKKPGETQFEEQENEELKKYSTAKRKAIFAWAITLPIMVWMIPEMFFGFSWPNSTIFNLGIIILAAPVIFYSGWTTY